VSAFGALKKQKDENVNKLYKMMDGGGGDQAQE